MKTLSQKVSSEISKRKLKTRDYIKKYSQISFALMDLILKGKTDLSASTRRKIRLFCPDVNDFDFTEMIKTNSATKSPSAAEIHLMANKPMMRSVPYSLAQRFGYDPNDHSNVAL